MPKLGEEAWRRFDVGLVDLIEMRYYQMKL